MVKSLLTFESNFEMLGIAKQLLFEVLFIKERVPHDGESCE